MVSLIYHKNLGPDWIRKVKLIKDDLKCSIIGRSKKQKLIIGQDYVTEEYQSINQSFKLNLYDATGLIVKKDIRFNGNSYSILINKDDFNNTKEIIWYALIGEGVGSFNIFSTIYFIDKRDGSTEHSF